MKINYVLIINNETKEIRKDDHFKDQEWLEHNEYIWEEGNYACDCNRSIFWHSALDPKGDHESDECGSDKYSCVVVSDDNVILYDDSLDWVEWDFENECPQ